MLHANTLLLAYRYSNASIALHAAAVASDKDCIIFPGASGAGKSTLSAALMLEGFRFCSDDLVLLTDSNLSVIPMSFCIGLKEGAWETVAARSPIVADLATHIREDGKAIRYLPPLSVSQTVGRSERLRARLLVFPTFDPNGRNLLNEMSPGSALVRLAESGYDVTPGLDKATLRRLIEWIESIQCVELRYDELNYAIDKIVSLATGKH